MSFSFRTPKVSAMDPELIRIVSVVVAESMFEVQSSISALEEQMTDFQGRLASLEKRTAEQTLNSRLASLEAAAAATAKGLEELRVSPQGRAPATAGPQQPVTYYDFRELEEKVRALASEVVPAKFAQSMPSAESLLKKFGDVDKEQTSLRECCDAVHEQVSSLEEQIEHWRISWAIFALSALNLKESDRRDCLSRLKDEEERMRRVKFGTTSSPEISPASSSWGLPTIRSGVVAPPCLNRSQVHP